MAQSKINIYDKMTFIVSIKANVMNMKWLEKFTDLRFIPCESVIKYNIFFDTLDGGYQFVSEIELKFGIFSMASLIALRK